MKITILTLLFLTLSSFAANVSIKTVKVADEAYAPNKEFFAKTAYKEALIKEITLRFSGYIEKLYAGEKYSFVSVGAPLFEVYSPEIYTLKEEMLKSLEYIKKMEEYGDETLTKSAKSLFYSSRERLLLLGVSKAEVEKTISTRAASKNITIHSPYAGTVLEKPIFQGSFAEAGKPLLKLSSTGALWIEVKIYEKDAAGLKIGDKVSAQFAASQKTYTSKIEQILPEINDKDRTLTARVSIKSDGFLRANMFGKATIIQKSSKFLTLPKTAVLDRGKKQFVFVKVDKKFEPQEIKAIKLDNLKYKIVEGLSAGDEVAAEALFLLDSDAKINGLY